MSFDSLGLDARLMAGVKALGYAEATPIQADAIPSILEGRDVVGCAQTGTGKTAAFVLPMLQNIGENRRGIRALVVTPTRELALQVAQVATTAGRPSRVRIAVAHGGVDIKPQIAALRRGVDVFVATPGRLLDLQQRGELHLDKVEVLVLDEADRMLDMGFWPDVRRILALLPVRRQNLLFSATISKDVLRVVGSTLTDPVSVSVTPTTTPKEEIEQFVYPVAPDQKTDLLVAMLESRHHERVLVFTRTKHRAARLQRVLERKGISCAAIHGDRTQPQRKRALEAFRDGQIKVLVATDVVARGIDITGISHVINFDMPATPEEYVHRIGRTARAGASGRAYSLLSPEETDNLHRIERTIGQTLACEDVEGFEYAQRIVPKADRDATQTRRVVWSGGGRGGGRSGVMGRRGGRGR